MALLMSFFVMVAAYSTQDQKKLQLVAGSMRDAFGTNKESRYVGIIEQDGIPTKARAEERAPGAPGGGCRIHHPEQSRSAPGGPVGDGLRSRLRARGGLAPPGAAGHAGDRRTVEEHHHR